MNNQPTPSPLTFNRRSFLAMAAAVGLSACSGGSSSNGSSVSSGGVVRMLNWPDYITTATRSGLAVYGPENDFEFVYEDEFGTTVDIDTLNEDLEGPGGKWDIVTVPNWLAAQLINRGLIEQLPIEFIPNHANLDPALMTNTWDRGSRYQMPWQVGITGIAYNTTKVGPITSAQALFDRANAGRVGFVTEMREALGLAMLVDGADPSLPTEEAAEAGMARIEEAVGAGQVGRFGDVDMIELLSSGQVDIAMAWSGDARALDSDFAFVIPDEGAIQWFDTMMIPKNAWAAEQAALVMNYVYEPLNAAELTRGLGYISPVMGVAEELAGQDEDGKSLIADPLVFPSAQDRARLYTWGGLDQAFEDQLDERYAELVDSAG